MSTNSIKKIERMYAAMQSQLCVEAGPSELAEATQFQANRNRPIHRWFHFKEGFGANLLTAAGVNTSSLSREDTVFLDPFCGSGTTLVAGDIDYKWKARRVGLEINPFLCFVAETKANWRKYDPNRLGRLIRTVLADPFSTRIERDKWPALSTLRNTAMFTPYRVGALLEAIERVRQIVEPERDLLLLGIAAAAEHLGYYRKDGRALRILRSPGEIDHRKRLRVKDTLCGIWTSYADDLRQSQEHRAFRAQRCTIQCSDGRALSLPERLQVESGQVSLIAYSPPYLNHIDYTEVYKVELWLLGFVTSQREMLDLRKRTLRSHASVGFSAEGAVLPKSVREAIETAASEIAATGKNWHRHFGDTAFGYLEDLHLSLSRQYELLHPGSQAICVVANSAHGSGDHRIPIASDLFIATVAADIGFQVEKLVVARQMRRRDSLNSFLRETVIVLRRPAVV